MTEVRLDQILKDLVDEIITVILFPPASHSHVLSRDLLPLLGAHEGEGKPLQLQGLQGLARRKPGLGLDRDRD